MNQVRSSVFVFILFIMLTAAGCSGSENYEANTDASLLPAETDFDEQLAEELGADDYGMKRYVMAFLKAGPNRDMDETEAMEIQRAHLNNIRRMAEEGDLVLAGPFMGDGDIRGIYIFNVATVEEARELTNTDPAVEAGRLEMELHPWYGSAALIKVNDIHATISKENP